MNSQLILIEGLPGSGKSTIARWVNEILSDIGVRAEIFLEGNLDHPADYDGVAYYKEAEFHRLISEHGEFGKVLNHLTEKRETDYFVPYQKMKNEYDIEFTNELWNKLFKHDIYELPFEENRKLIIEKWKRFSEEAVRGTKTFVLNAVLSKIR